MKNEKYSIGLDIGTTSVGWSVVSMENISNPKIVRKGNKYLWGVRLFEDAQTAADRRMYRGSRRRYARRRERIKRLQEIFKDEINKVDPDFFQKMRDFFYADEDYSYNKINLTKEDKELVFNKYKTIYHLRDELINSSSCNDIRLIYLAIHHIIKYRGNFLYDTDTFNVSKIDIPGKLNEIVAEIEMYDDLVVESETLDYDKFANCITEKSKNDRKAKTKEYLKAYFNTNFINEFCKLIVGNKFNVNKLLNIDAEEKLDISFKGADYDEKIDKIMSVCGEKIDVLYALKELYDMVFLNDLFKGHDNTSISSLMVSKYEEHKKDLRYLKDLLKSNNKVYTKLFKDSEKEKCTYRKYVDNNLMYEDFIKDFKDYVDDKEYKKKIEDGMFMPRITDKDNGKYPYQLNKEELIKIISNYETKFPFLADKVIVDGKEEYKLVQLLSFRIPYYVGPLNNTTSNCNIKNKNSWISLKEGFSLHDVTPYNFEQVVDKDSSAEEFIMRMISKCTYVVGEYAMPNNSILYSKFKVLNELKQITLNGDRISPKNVMEIYNELFLKKSGTITEKVFTQYLYTKDFASMYDGSIEIKGYSADKKFANNMQSYIDFFGEEGIFSNTNYKIDDAEKIIEWITIFEDKDILERKIRKEFADLSEQQIKKAVNKKYKGWGNLSRKLLTDIYYAKDEFSEQKSILDLMEETQENFMQILFNRKYKFQDKIDKLNIKDSNSKISYSLVEDLATSPANKRGIYQALKIVDELINYIGYLPEHICIEMARGDEKKGRTSDRKKYLQDIYVSTNNQIKDYKQLMAELKKIDEKEFTDKLFLYFIQEAKCLYCGESIDIEHLEKYEIDHIIPRTLIKDDSLDNKALVCRNCNQLKGADLVLPRQYRNDQNRKWWEHLYSVNLISKKKYRNLIRDKYDKSDIEGFINRQIVETRQITKHVANIINNIYYNDSKNKGVIYINANLTHQYREKNKLYKFRDLNDYHHAYDSYLAVALGEYVTNVIKDNVDIDYLKKVTKDLYQSINSENRNEIYKKLSYGLVINSIDNNYALADEHGEIKVDLDQFNEIMINNYYRNDMIVTKKTEIKTGALFNETKNPHGGKGVPLKKGLSTKLYGAYTRLNPACALVVKYTKGKKEQQRMVGMPIYYKKQSVDVQTEYIRDLLRIGVNDKLEIVKDNIPFYSLINWQGQICYLVGATENVEVCNALEFNMSKEYNKRWANALNRLFNNIKEIDDEIYNTYLGEIIKYIIDKVEKEYKLYSDLVPKMKKMFMYDNINSLSLEQKEFICKEMFKLLKCNSVTANLKKLDADYSMAFGKKGDRIIESAVVINNSITGVYKKEYEF